MSDEHDPETQIEDENPFERRSGYEVGYGKPPRQHRFHKGNKAAAGKRKHRKPRGIAQTLMKIAGETVDVGMNGKRVRMTRKEALMRQLFDKAMKSPRDGLRMAQLLLGIEDQMPFDPVDQSRITIEFVGSRPKGLPGGPGDQDRSCHPQDSAQAKTPSPRRWTA